MKVIAWLLLALIFGIAVVFLTSRRTIRTILIPPVTKGNSDATKQLEFIEKTVTETNNTRNHVYGNHSGKHGHLTSEPEIKDLPEPPKGDVNIYVDPTANTYNQECLDSHVEPEEIRIVDRKQ